MAQIESGGLFIGKSRESVLTSLSAWIYSVCLGSQNCSS